MILANMEEYILLIVYILGAICWNDIIKKYPSWRIVGCICLIFCTFYLIIYYSSIIEFSIFNVFLIVIFGCSVISRVLNVVYREINLKKKKDKGLNSKYLKGYRDAIELITKNDL